jgi:hypothetical protein
MPDPSLRAEISHCPINYDHITHRRHKNRLFVFRPHSVGSQQFHLAHTNYDDHDRECSENDKIIMFSSSSQNGSSHSASAVLSCNAFKVDALQSSEVIKKASEICCHRGHLGLLLSSAMFIECRSHFCLGRKNNKNNPSKAFEHCCIFITIQILWL